MRRPSPPLPGGPGAPWDYDSEDTSPGASDGPASSVLLRLLSDYRRRLVHGLQGAHGNTSTNSAGLPPSAAAAASAAASSSSSTSLGDDDDVPLSERVEGLARLCKSLLAGRDRATSLFFSGLFQRHLGFDTRHMRCNRAVHNGEIVALLDDALRYLEAGAGGGAGEGAADADAVAGEAKDGGVGGVGSGRDGADGGVGFGGVGGAGSLGETGRGGRGGRDGRGLPSEPGYEYRKEDDDEEEAGQVATYSLGELGAVERRQLDIWRSGVRCDLALVPDRDPCHDGGDDSAPSAGTECVAHSMVLMSWSDFFSTMLMGSFEDSGAHRVRLPGVRGRCEKGREREREKEKEDVREDVRECVREKMLLNPNLTL